MVDGQQQYPYPISPLARAFPPLRPALYAALVARINRYGFRPPIIVWRREIIHGVELLTAYIEAGVEPRFELLSDDADPVEIIAAEAIPSQEMDDNARAVGAYLLSQWSTRGRSRIEDENCANLRNITQGEAAVLFGVSIRLVSYAARVLSGNSAAVPALRQAVREWKVKCSDATRVLGRPADMQERAVGLVSIGEVKTVKRAVEQVEREIAHAAESEALADVLARPLDETITLHVATVADLLQRQLVTRASLDAIITCPPHTEDKLYLLSDLADLAADALKPTGCMVVVGHGVLLPRILEHLDHQGLRWIGEFDLLFHGPTVRSGRPHFLNLHRRPVLLYGKPAFRLDGGDDLINVPPPDELPLWLDRNETAMRLIVERFCRPGHALCDPIMLDRAGTALAARLLGCTFIGAMEQQFSRDRIQKRLEAGDGPTRPAVNGYSGPQTSYG